VGNVLNVLWEESKVCFVNREESIGADVLPLRDRRKGIRSEASWAMDVPDILQSGGVLLQPLHTTQGIGEKLLQLCHSLGAVQYVFWYTHICCVLNV